MDASPDLPSENRPASAAALAAIALALGLALIEVAAAGFWRSHGGPAALEDYRRRQDAALTSRYVEPLGLVLPVVGLERVERKEGYADRWRTRDIFRKGFGLFDGGLDDRPERALALGDSFTRGDGALDAALQGWVALVERRLGWLDLVNLADASGGFSSQIGRYERLGPLVEHRWVLLNFYSGDDFVEGAEPFDWSKTLGGLPPEEDRARLYAETQRALLFDDADDFLARSPVRSRAVWALLRLGQRLLGTGFSSPEARRLKRRFARLEADAADPLVPPDAAALGRSNRAGARLVPAAGERRVAGRLFPYHGDARQAEVLAGNAAAAIGRFHAGLKGRGKGLILVIHPSLWEVYWSPREWKLAAGRPDRAVKLLKERLPRDLPVLDLTDRFRRLAQESPSPLYWLETGEYSPEGHAEAAAAIADFLSETIRGRRATAGRGAGSSEPRGRRKAS